MKYGSIPAGGLGTRLQPIGFSKELAPVKNRAVIDYLLERLVRAGIDRIFINTAEDKTDLIRYLASKSPYRQNLIFLVRERRGLLDGVTLPAQYLSASDELYFGLPDTIWYPTDAFAQLMQDKCELTLGLFDTGTPEKFDSVTINAKNEIQSIEVKVSSPKTKWTWAIGKMTARVAGELRAIEASNQLGPGEFGRAMHLYAQTHPAHALQLAGSSCLDIGVPNEYLRANAFVAEQEKL